VGENVVKKYKREISGQSEKFKISGENFKISGQ